MSGRSRTGQNCFGVGTPILSPLPPAGNTAATASGRRPGSAPAALSGEAEAASSAPGGLLRQGPRSAGLEPPGGPGSMAAGDATGPARPGPKRPALLRPSARVAEWRADKREGRRARRRKAPGWAAGLTAAGPQGMSLAAAAATKTEAADLPSPRGCGLCTRAQRPREGLACLGQTSSRRRWKCLHSLST